MPRSSRKAAGGVIYHALNRGNGRQRLFHKPADYDAFVALLAEVKRAVPGVRVLAYCLMPNHWHLVLWPRHDGELSRFMQRLLTAHVRRHHAHYRRDGGGHLYQGRFKSFPVQRDDLHLLTVLRYVESNPLRSSPPLARKPGGWRWTSFAARAAPRPPEALLDEWPVDRPRHWERRLAEPLDDRRRDALLASLARGRPFGDGRWVERAAGELGLAHTLRPRGRPRKHAQNPATSTPDTAGRQGGRRRRAKG